MSPVQAQSKSQAGATALTRIARSQFWNRFLSAFLGSRPSAIAKVAVNKCSELVFVSNGMFQTQFISFGHPLFMSIVAFLYPAVASTFLCQLHGFPAEVLLDDRSDDRRQEHPGGGVVFSWLPSKCDICMSLGTGRCSSLAEVVAQKWIVHSSFLTCFCEVGWAHGSRSRARWRWNCFCPSVATLTHLGSMGKLAFLTLQLQASRCDLGNPFVLPLYPAGGNLSSGVVPWLDLGRLVTVVALYGHDMFQLPCG